MIVLSWPPRELHPNARPHYHAKASAAKAYRETAYWLAKTKGDTWLHNQDAAQARISFYPPDKRRRDLDGMLASVKAGMDGIADAFGINDYQINPITIMRCEPVKGGKIVVSLS